MKESSINYVTNSGSIFNNGNSSNSNTSTIHTKKAIHEYYQATTRRRCTKYGPSHSPTAMNFQVAETLVFISRTDIFVVVVIRRTDEERYFYLYGTKEEDEKAEFKNETEKETTACVYADRGIQTTTSN